MSEDPALLHRYPGALGLPTVDPQALALETALRFLQVRYVKKDAAMRDLRMVIPPSRDSPPEKDRPAEPITLHGFRDCMRYLSALTDVDVVQSDHQHVGACVEGIATTCLFPAFTFFVHFEPNLFHYGLRKVVVPKVGGFWERLSGSFRRNILRSNVFSYVEGAAHGPTPFRTESRQVAEVLGEVEKAFRALERLHLSYARTDETFFSGTSSPSSTDAYVYAGVSSFLHADFGGPHGSPQLAAFQATVKEECAHLVKYVEWMRQMFYEDYNGKYGLKKTTAVATAEMVAAAAEDAYASGRTRVLFTTGVFAFLYFIFANSDVIVSLLEEVLSSDKVDMVTSEPEEENQREEPNL
ncbi:unnamed protein product [Phytomonas sp. Hart1]|nr:unnamed protein product [Phytomonas sp. Hart1]|eukprot:CCW70377.1 unnamed protein product [Phytomonas sp. isolate Hart1]